MFDWVTMSPFISGLNTFEIIVTNSSEVRETSSREGYLCMSCIQILYFVTLISIFNIIDI